MAALTVSGPFFPESGLTGFRQVAARLSEPQERVPMGTDIYSL